MDAVCRDLSMLKPTSTGTSLENFSPDLERVEEHIPQAIS